MSNKCRKTTKKYKTILADPPWDVHQKGTYGAVSHYNLMSLEEIKNIPISDLCEENAHCYLWTTAATLHHGFDVLKAWGFTYRSIFIWLNGTLKGSFRD
jgi:N6-adenosine-specific RNA methylase IME4